MLATQLFGSVDIVVACLIGLLLVIAAIASIPEWIRYLKLSSM